MNYFDDEAATWDDEPAHVERTNAIAEAIAARVPLSPEWDVLEYGGGTGALARLLADRVRTVLLVDSSMGMIAEARRRLEGEEIAVDPVLLDFETDPLPRRRFDAVVASMVLHHIDDVGAMLVRFAELLDDDGYLVAADLARDPDGEYHGPGFTGHHGIGEDEIAALLADAGLRVESIETVFHVVRRDAAGAERRFPIWLAVARAGSA